MQSVFALVSDVHDKAVFREALTEVGGCLRFIFDD